MNRTYGNVSVHLYDIHVEVMRGGATVPIPHKFQSRPLASQSVVRMEDAGLLVEGDSFRNEAVPDHRKTKRGKAFARGRLSERGSFFDSGQTLVRVGGRPVVIRAGRLETCCEGIRQKDNAVSTRLHREALLFIEGHPVFTGITY